jgi:SPP1 gp7 family putative phage head morphogenesis protein
VTRLAADQAARKKPKTFAASKRAEEAYARQLRKISRHVADIVRGLAPDGVVTPEADFSISAAMKRYSEVLEPWAASVASRMLDDMSRRDGQVWMAHSERIGRALRSEVASGATGQALKARLADQVALITSLPLDAAQRVHDLTIKGLVEGRRPDEIADEILRTGEVSASRATLIARTEVARTASILTEVRAKSIGCTHFVWQTSKDASVRPSHRKMQGRTFAFADPPIVDGQPLIPGQTYNCRCFIQPVLPD